MKDPTSGSLTRDGSAHRRQQVDARQAGRSRSRPPLVSFTVTLSCSSFELSGYVTLYLYRNSIREDYHLYCSLTSNELNFPCQPRNSPTSDCKSISTSAKRTLSTRRTTTGINTLSRTSSSRTRAAGQVHRVDPHLCAGPSPGARDYFGTLFGSPRLCLRFSAHFTARSRLDSRNNGVHDQRHRVGREGQRISDVRAS